MGQMRPRELTPSPAARPRPGTGPAPGAGSPPAHPRRRPALRHATFSEPQVNVIPRLALRLSGLDVGELPLVLNIDPTKTKILETLDELLPAREARSRLDDVEMPIELEGPMGLANVVGEVRPHQGEREDRHVERLVFQRDV